MEDEFSESGIRQPATRSRKTGELKNLLGELADRLKSQALLINVACKLSQAFQSSPIVAAMADRIYRIPVPVAAAAVSVVMRDVFLAARNATSYSLEFAPPAASVQNLSKFPFLCFRRKS